MLLPRDTFSALLAPLTTEVFFAEHFDRRRVHVPADAARSRASMLSLRDFEAYLRTRRPWELRRPGPPMVKLVRDGKAGPPVTSLDDIVRGCHDGMSVVSNAMEPSIPTIGDTCAALEEVFGMASWANAYFSPKGSRGFPAHIDTHDVLIVQTHGSKRWEIYQPTVFPAPKRQWFDGEAELRIVSEQMDLAEPEVIELREGDLLYLPRGIPHAAEATDSASLHLTFGVEVLTWGELLALCARDLAIHDVALRRAVPPDLRRDSNDAPALERFKRHAAQLLQEADVQRALGRRRRSASVSGPAHPLSTLGDAGDLSGSSLVRLTVGPVEIGSHLGHPWLAVGERKVGLPIRTEPYARFLLEHREFRVDDLPDTLPGDSKRTFVRWLLREGLATVSSG